MATRQEVREHIDAEARILTWFQSDASGEQRPTRIELTDLDSFATVQLVLSLEEAFGTQLLEDLGEFKGKSFDDLVDFALERIGQSPPP